VGGVIIVRGASSKIAQELNEIVPIRAVGRDEPIPLDGKRYLFCLGLLRAKSSSEQSVAEKAEGWQVNYSVPVRDCNLLIEKNDRARICVIGSESAWTGSYDGTYADSKRALHEYVMGKRLRTAAQQLVCIAPGVIGDAGMCVRRTDLERLEKRREAHPQKRFLWASEVSRFVHFVLCVDRGYLSGVVLRMNGGEHTCTNTQ
jgi:NAD(P)-dependent dehydrogenase (short-subunit alcohol dehydrogenase family)